MCFYQKWSSAIQSNEYTSQIRLLASADPTRMLWMCRDSKLSSTNCKCVSRHEKEKKMQAKNSWNNFNIKYIKLAAITVRWYCEVINHAQMANVNRFVDCWWDHFWMKFQWQSITFTNTPQPVNCQPTTGIRQPTLSSNEVSYVF